MVESRRLRPEAVDRSATGSCLQKWWLIVVVVCLLMRED